MNRLALKTRTAKKQLKKLLCAYLTLGYPSLSFTEKLIQQFDKGGVDILELGFPFSDPLADGPTIQEASYRSLQKHTSIHDAFDVVNRVRTRGCSIPIVFFSYYNPILNFGEKKFIAAIKKSGYDGIICPDLPFEEGSTLRALAKENDIACTYLIAPTSSDARVKKLSAKSSGFIYYVSRRGVTGAQSDMSNDLQTNIAKIRKVTKKPILVGFGVSDAKQANKIGRIADGVIVGSAIINKISQTKSVPKVMRFVDSLVTALKKI